MKIIHLFIFAYISSQLWAALADVSIENWDDLSPKQCTHLTKLFSDLTTPIVIKEGKINVEEDSSYILVFNHPELGDRLYSFSYSRPEDSALFTQIALESNLEERLLESVPGTEKCSAEEVDRLFEFIIKKDSEYLILNISDVRSETPNKSVDGVVGNWHDTPPKVAETLYKSFDMLHQKMEIEGVPKIQQLMQTRFAFILKDALGNMCTIFIRLNKNLRIMSFENPNSNPKLAEISETLFSPIKPCPPDFLAKLLQIVKVKEVYVGLVRTLFPRIESEISSALKSGEFSDWKRLSDENVVTINQILKTSSKMVKAISGMFNEMRLGEYVLVMIDEYYDPCSMYLLSEKAVGNAPTLKIQKLSEVELTEDILQNVDPCSDEVIANLMAVDRLLI